MIQMNTYAIARKNAWNPRSDRAALARLTLAGAPVLLFALALASPAAALQQKLTATDGAAGDHLGASVAVDGDTLVPARRGAAPDGCADARRRPAQARAHLPRAVRQP
jgi:hypothetical protein